MAFTDDVRQQLLKSFGLAVVEGAEVYGPAIGRLALPGVIPSSVPFHRRPRSPPRSPAGGLG